MKVTALLLTDTHFRADNILEGQEFVEKFITKAEQLCPTFIVHMGDIYEHHETLKVGAMRIAEYLFERLSYIAPVYILIGNHDYTNNRQFLTSNHGLNALKKWNNITVVDKVISREIYGKQFVFCPYVPPGRFHEALDTLHQEQNVWEMAECIFTHITINGCYYGNGIVTDADDWDEDDPPVISGHIHEPQTIGKNVFYPGSSVQVKFNESPNKRVWYINFSAEDPENGYFDYKKIDLKMKWKKQLRVKIDDLDSIDFDDASKKYKLSVAVLCNKEEFRAFKISEKYTSLIEQGIRVVPHIIEENVDTEGGVIGKKREHVSYIGVLRDIVRNSDDENLHNSFRKVLDIPLENIETTIVFDE